MKVDLRLRKLLDDLGEAELDLLKNHRIRLHVDRVTPDGRNIICSAAQVQRRFLRVDLPAEEGVQACHHALSPMHLIGLSPMIAWLPRNLASAFIVIVPNDPFGLKQALRAAGIGERLFPNEATVTYDHQREQLG